MIRTVFGLILSENSKNNTDLTSTQSPTKCKIIDVYKSVTLKCYIVCMH